MRNLMMVVVAMVLSATLNLVQAQNAGKGPFEAKTERLVTYLELAPYQVTEVEKINDYFIKMQSESVWGTPELKEKKMQNAVFSNLKLMKGTLTADQYRKYVQLLNVTNNNNRLLGEVAISDVYLAERK